MPGAALLRDAVGDVDGWLEHLARDGRGRSAEPAERAALTALIASL